ncbi:hypothetical protein KUTeg_024933 [Tegillarca granosa]|uniref:Lipocalin/cytosolic fatty-acid binding domain-containing protein n=1 Tax=Tegillarca granosa TaxID=220873 RepID=A0ABQ9DZF8_TEGGR|nr:hypothetical protein KUTeg_024933 [Tegillarca granosa]
MLGFFIILISSFSLSKQQVFSSGKCPTVTLQKDFNLKEYLGDWYEIVKFPASFESGSKCAKAHYQLLPNGHINITNSGIKPDGTPTIAYGEAKIVATDGTAKLELRFSNLAPWGNYWVLDTDYKNYTLIYSCTNIAGLSHFEFAWILSRKRTLDEVTKDRLYNEMEKFKIDTKHFITMDQTDFLLQIPIRHADTSADGTTRNIKVCAGILTGLLTVFGMYMFGKLPVSVKLSSTPFSFTLLQKKSKRTKPNMKNCMKML